jgi:glycosyltransferase involved in cell wall biosynthesis
LYEAAAAGLPFLSVPVGTAEEIARWTGGGEICPARRDAQGYTRVDPSLLAQHIQALASSPDKLKVYGEAGRRNWLERFTWERITDRYEEILGRLLSERKGNVGAHPRPAALHPASEP